MLEAILYGGRGIESFYILMCEPEELTPVKGYPVPVSESLGYIIRVGRNQKIFQVLQHLTTFSWVLLDFLLFEGVAGNLRLPVCVVTGPALKVNAS